MEKYGTDTKRSKPTNSQLARIKELSEKLGREPIQPITMELAQELIEELEACQWTE